MTLPGFDPPSVRFVAWGFAIHGSAPERVSVTLMLANGLLPVKYVPVGSSASVPRSSGLGDVYGVLITKVPAGMVAWMFWSSEQTEPGCAHGDDVPLVWNAAGPGCAAP